MSRNKNEGPANLREHIFQSGMLKSVVQDGINFLKSTPVLGLPPPFVFEGSGVYALYYIGRFELYQKVAKANAKHVDTPIYVGKAVPPGWRTARISISSNSALSNRLNEHARSIMQCSSLDVKDFRCRFVILSGNEGDLIVPIEAELIRTFKPLWNWRIDGFGNHDPGAGRYNQAKSEWDVLHPGRSWAGRLTGESPRLEDIIKKLKSG